MTRKVAVTGCPPLLFQSMSPAQRMSPGQPPLVVHTEKYSSMGCRGRERGTVRTCAPSRKNLTYRHTASGGGERVRRGAGTGRSSYAWASTGPTVLASHSKP